LTGVIPSVSTARVVAGALEQPHVRERFPQQHAERPHVTPTIAGATTQPLGCGVCGGATRRQLEHHVAIAHRERLGRQLAEWLTTDLRLVHDLGSRFDPARGPELVEPARRLDDTTQRDRAARVSAR